MQQYPLLEQVNSPAQLKALPAEELPALCAEIREFLIRQVSRTGGHLASNLGAVELTVAIHRCFDTERDRLVFDVGHQCYVHKALTGRQELFATLRQLDGLSGFPKPRESIHDAFIAGHASNSVSVALGMARARTLQHQDHQVLALIGDGALSGGLAYEGLNDAGASGEPLIVILNDNGMSINANVGAVSEHLERLRSRPAYYHFKKWYRGLFGKHPAQNPLYRFNHRVKTFFKRSIYPSSTLFEDMGFTYLGPVDGHDLKSVCEFLALAKKMKKPVLLHVMTQKGRGYAPSEQHPEKYHGVSKFDRVTGESLVPKKEDFSACFGGELCALAEKDARICAITAAMPSGTGLTRFAEKFPERFFDVGIAEEHAVGMAAGMAAQGLVPVAAIYSTFLQRAYDQIVHDIAIEGLHVVLCVDRAGIVGADGATHNGVLDIAFLRSIPGMKIFCPSDFAELRVMLSRAIYRENGPVAVRYPRGGEGAYRKELSAQPLVRVQERFGREVSIITHGVLLNQALDAADILEKEGIRADVYKVNEIGSGLEAAFAEKAQELGSWCVVVEDVVPNGSVGEWFAAHRTARTDLLNTGDRFLPHGGVSELYRHCGIDAEGIAAYIIKNRNRKENGVG